MDYTVIHLLSNSDIINLVTKSVLDEKGDEYMYAATNVWGNESFSFLYLPRPPIGAGLPAIVLEIQKNVTNVSMKQSIEYCLQVNQRYNYQVYFILLCTGQISSTVKKTLSTNSDNPYWQQLRNTLWAKKCLFVLKDTIKCSGEDGEQHLDPLAALVLYIASNNEQRLKLNNVADSTIQLLCTVSESASSEMS